MSDGRDRMTYPPNRTMETLHALSCGTELACVGEAGTLVVLHTAPGLGWVVEEGEVEELERRRWVDLSTDGEVTLTESGRYWLNRWLKSNRLAL